MSTTGCAYALGFSSKNRARAVKHLTWTARIATLPMNKEVVIFICSKVLAIKHHKSLNCRLNEISTEQPPPVVDPTV
ncbi:hypothetical protein [Nostoc sp.]|uniref:hypothetical protein n=1 Tax=Nostoc sp. TaxID=1180 RepID=UPI002FF6F331